MEVIMNCDFIRTANQIVVLTAALVTIKTGLSDAAETCTFQQGATSVLAYCETNCCETQCCSTAEDSGVDTTLILIILGVVVAVVIAVLVIIAIVCCLNDRKKDREIQKKLETIELTSTPTSTGESSLSDSDRPKLHREKAVLDDNSSQRPVRDVTSSKSKYAAQKRRRHSKETVFFKNEVTPSPRTPVRTVSGGPRTVKVRPRTDSSLPQVEEVQEDLEIEEEV